MLRDLHVLVAKDRATTAMLLAHIAEVKERKLYAPAGQPHMHDLLREAQDLLAHTESGRQISNVLTRALELLVRHLKQRRFAEAKSPRRSARKPKSVRTIPAEVKRAVKTRDEGRCTFVNERGERCPARSRLEYDHKYPVAKGGETTVENLRLRCHTHNQLAAEKAFGVEFMNEKRDRAKRGSAKKKTAHAQCDASPELPSTPATQMPNEAALREQAYEVIPWLRAAIGASSRRAVSLVLTTRGLRPPGPPPSTAPPGRGAPRSMAS